MRNVKKKPDDGSTNVGCCRVCPETVNKSPITKKHNCSKNSSPHKLNRTYGI